MRISCAQAGLRGFGKSQDDLLFNLENGSCCGWALITKERRGRWGLSGDGKVAYSWVQRGSGEVGRALAWPSTQAVHVALQSDSWCFALPFGRCHDLAAFSLCAVWELEHGGPEEKDIESFATPGSPHGWVNRSRVLLGVARFGRVCWLGSGVG